MKLQAITKSMLMLSLPLLLAGCLSSSGGQSTNKPTEQGLTKLGQRSYVLSLPANYQADKSYRLLLVFHGSGGNGSEMKQTARFDSYTDDYIVAYPNSMEVEWNEGCGCNIAHRKKIDDLGFVDELIIDIKSKYQIADGEIYAAGFSQGGLFTQNLACNRSSTFKAVAVVAGSMSTQLAAACNPDTPLSVMMVHGLHDSVLPFFGYDHPNFGLISSPDAIFTHADKHQSLPYQLVKPMPEISTGLISYNNGTQKFNLYNIANGGHSWRFTSFDTSEHIIRFFDTLDLPELPEHSQLVSTERGEFHVRTMGSENSGPAVVLLPGPNYNYHSDTAWFAALQPLLAQQYKVHSIDRPGNGYSSFNEQVSYTRFADDLAAVLQQLGETELLLVSFSSASISARQFYQQYQQQFDVKAMLYVDPDIPTPHALSLYQGYPADWYLANLEALLPHLAAGNWTERTRTKLDQEYEEVKQLVARYNAPMDWTYYEQIMQRRLLIPHQQSRALEIAHYTADLNSYASLPMVTGIPVSVIDSDFESAQIAAAEDQSLAAALLQWQQEGSAWSSEQASLSNGQYVALTDSDHLVPVEQPAQIKQAIDWLFSQLQLN